MPARDDTLALLKALSDETRFRCLEVVRAADSPVSVAEVALELGLHQNTVRPHLERLRDVGVLNVAARPTGLVGRPQNLYSPKNGWPTLGLDPRNFRLLADMLATLASRMARPEDAVDVGREWGARYASRPLIEVFESLGFDPIEEGGTVTFSTCPFLEVAEAHPDLVCAMHRGLCEGMADIEAFHPLGSRDPCTVVLARP